MRPDQQSEIIRQLQCEAGRLNAVTKMAEAGQPCKQVLHQLNAVQSALHITGTKLLICQIQSSEAVILHNSSPKQRISELKRLQTLYTVFMQYSNHHGWVSSD